ncbi:MAG: helix-turn-helix domain-containing protein [Fibrobacter sp.]|nr:helix-turn-helix domain-containing protein [Fibrobacter sp.]
MNFVEDKKADERLGEYIARIRTARGMSLEDLSAVTKVTVSHLKLIEAGDWKAFPVEAYIRGYLNSICVKLNMDPQKVRSWYGSEIGDPSKNPFEDVSSHDKISPSPEGESKKRSKAVPIVIVLIGLAFLVASRFLDMGDVLKNDVPAPADKPEIAVDTTAEQPEIPEGAVMVSGDSVQQAEKTVAADSNSLSQAQVDEAVKKKGELPASATIFISSDSKKDTVPAPTNKTSLELIGSGEATSWIGIKRRENSDRFLKEAYISKAGMKVTYNTEDTLSITIGEPKACAKLILNGVETPLPTTRYGRVIKFRVFGGQIIK